MSTKTPNKQASEKEQNPKRVARKSQQPDQTLQPSPTEALQRAANAPRSALRPADILALQGSVGNRAVQRLVDGAPTGGAAPMVIQRHISDGLKAQMDANFSTMNDAGEVLWQAQSDALAAGREAAKHNTLVSQEVGNASEAFTMLRTGVKGFMGNVDQGSQESCESETDEGGEAG